MENTNVTVSNSADKRRFSKSLRILGSLFVIVVLLYGLLSYLGRPYNKDDNTYIDITIAKGATTEEVSETLATNGIIGNEKTFRFLSTVLMYNNKYKPGFYSLSPSMNVNTIANTLINGITTDDGFTIPAGYTLEQTAEALDQAGFADKDKFLAIAKSGIYNDLFNFLSGSSDLEGFLLPGKYEMSKDADENMILTTMLYQFDAYYNEEYRERAAELGLSDREVITLASIIEKEVTSDKEKPVIAGILLNRIISGLGIEGGFPDKPLCSPSKTSIEAVLYSESSSYYYYTKSSKLDGSHVYAETDDEYQILKSEYEKAKEARNKAAEDKSGE